MKEKQDVFRVGMLCSSGTLKDEKKINKKSSVFSRRPNKIQTPCLPNLASGKRRDNKNTLD